MTLRTLFHPLKKSKKCLFLVLWVGLIFLIGLYAPFFASSKPFLAYYEGKLYFPLFRILIYKNVYTKPLDLFFNLLMFTLPLGVLIRLFIKNKRAYFFGALILMQVGAFYYLNTHVSLGSHAPTFQKIDQTIAALEGVSSTEILEDTSPLQFYMRPPITCHWEQNALKGHSSTSNWNTVRINGQSLFATLLFGIRYSFTLAILACALAFLIGTLIGAISGFLGGRIDLLICRGLEVWESLPTLFVLLLLVSITKEVSFFFVVFVLALFSWTSIARVVRIEMIKHRHLAYVEVLKNMGTSKIRILFKHLLPNCYWMLISLMPHALIGAITYESALSFLGLGDRKSCSIGLLLDEARMAYPMEPSLFWPPTLLLMVILISLAWLGDSLRKVSDPKLNENPF